MARQNRPPAIRIPSAAESSSFQHHHNHLNGAPPSLVVTPSIMTPPDHNSQAQQSVYFISPFSNTQHHLNQNNSRSVSSYSSSPIDSSNESEEGDSIEYTSDPTGPIFWSEGYQYSLVPTSSIHTQGSYVESIPPHLMTPSTSTTSRRGSSAKSKNAPLPSPTEDPKFSSSRPPPLPNRKPSLLSQEHLPSWQREWGKIGTDRELRERWNLHLWHDFKNGLIPGHFGGDIRDWTTCVVKINGQINPEATARKLVDLQERKTFVLSRGKVVEEKKGPPRRQNKYIAYRSVRGRQLGDHFPAFNQCQISALTSLEWRESVDQEWWEDVAILMDEHRHNKFPGQIDSKGNPMRPDSANEEVDNGPTWEAPPGSAGSRSSSISEPKTGRPNLKSKRSVSGKLTPEQQSGRYEPYSRRPSGVQMARASSFVPVGLQPPITIEGPHRHSIDYGSMTALSAQGYPPHPTMIYQQGHPTSALGLYNTPPPPQPVQGLYSIEQSPSPVRPVPLHQNQQIIQMHHQNTHMTPLQHIDQNTYYYQTYQPHEWGFPSQGPPYSSSGPSSTVSSSQQTYYHSQQHQQQQQPQQQLTPVHPELQTPHDPVDYLPSEGSNSVTVISHHNHNDENVWYAPHSRGSTMTKENFEAFTAAGDFVPQDLNARFVQG